MWLLVFMVLSSSVKESKFSWLGCRVGIYVVVAVKTGRRMMRARGPRCVFDPVVIVRRKK
jgi:hypothetical protein